MSTLEFVLLTLTTGELTLSSDITIDGATTGDDKADITISGNKASRIFHMTGAATDVDLESLTLTGGSTTANGGAIVANSIATLDILDTTISGNSSTLGKGGQ